MECKNCGATAEQNFCQLCGQKTHLHRFTLGYFFHELLHALTHTDKGIFLLIKELAYKPGIVARDYLAGHRTKYFNPLTFLVLTSAISAYITYKTGYYAALSSRATDYPVSNLQREANEIIVNHGKLLTLVLIVPVRSFFSWLLFRKKGFNLAENLVLNSLLAGEISLFIICFSVPMFLLAPDLININNWIFQGVMVLYLTFSFWQFFKSGFFASFLKAVLVQLFFIISYWLLIMTFVLLKHLVLKF